MPKFLAISGIFFFYLLYLTISLIPRKINWFCFFSFFRISLVFYNFFFFKFLVCMSEIPSGHPNQGFFLWNPARHPYIYLYNFFYICIFWSFCFWVFVLFLIKELSILKKISKIIARTIKIFYMLYIIIHIWDDLSKPCFGYYDVMININL